MSYLELKVPPVVVTVSFALMMTGISRYLPTVQMPSIIRIGVATSIALAGCILCTLAIVEFRKNKTTVKPTRPSEASKLVDSSVYSLSRNPMYLSFALFLVALATILQSPYSIVGVLFYVSYMNRFQINPEEKAMRKQFGEQYDDYRIRVRRWL